MTIHRLLPHEGFKEGHINLKTIRYLKPRRTGHLWWRRSIEQATAVVLLYTKPCPGDELVYLREDGAQRNPTISKVEKFTETLDVYNLTLDWP